MKCTCPKCHAKIELDLVDVPEAGTTGSCPECKTRFNIFRESFGGRALRKSSELTCAPCGEELGAQTFCPGCGAQFPDYYVATLGKKRVRRSTAKLKLKGSPFPKHDRGMTHLPSLEMSMREEMAPESRPARRGLPKSTALIVAVLVLLVVAGIGGAYYMKYQAEKLYVKNFVLVTYGVQVGTDKCLAAGASMAAEWKAKTDAGESYRPRIHREDDRELGMINSNIEEAAGQLDKVPEKFKQCNDKLNRLRAVYGKARTLVQSPGNSYQGFIDGTVKVDAEYKQAARDFKAGMPPEMLEELTMASRRYKGLRPLLKI